MIQKAIVSEILDSFQLKIRIPKYDKLASSVDGVSSEDLSTGIICAYPGMEVAYTAGDVVLVAFENDEISKPVVLGLLYREGTNPDSVSKITGVDTAISSITEALDKINLSGLYTHIRYSNDNGATFTSLYDYVNVSEGSSYYEAKDIKVNPLSSTVTWSVSNSDGIDVTSSLNIETTIHVQPHNEDGSLEGMTFASRDSVFNIPINIRNLGSLYISFRILKDIDIADYHVSLSTDRDAVGTVYGDYIGILVDEQPEASVTVGDYVWGSLIDRSLSLIKELEASIIKRVELNEKALYGKTYTEITSDETGLLDAINVTRSEVNVGAAKTKVTFDSDKTTYIDIDDPSVHTVKMNVGKYSWRAEDGHLRLYLERS